MGGGRRLQWQSSAEMGRHKIAIHHAHMHCDHKGNKHVDSAANTIRCLKCGKIVGQIRANAS